MSQHFQMPKLKFRGNLQRRATQLSNSKSEARNKSKYQNHFLIRLIHEFVLDAGATSIPLSSRRSRLLSCLQYKQDTRGGEARCVQPESSFCLVSMTLLSWGKNTDSHVRSFSRERRSRLSPFDLLVAAKK